MSFHQGERMHLEYRADHGNKQKPNKKSNKNKAGHDMGYFHVNSLTNKVRESCMDN